MARKRATMREGPLAELFRKTEAAQRAQEAGGEPPEPPSADPRAEAALDKTVEHVPDFAREPEPPELDPEPPVAAAPAPAVEEVEEVEEIAELAEIGDEDEEITPTPRVADEDDSEW